MDRRVAIKWMLAAGAGAVIGGLPRAGAAPDPGAAPQAPAAGYGKDPDLMRSYKPGDLWPLTFTDAQRRQAAALCDVIIPADDHSPSASAVGVVDFLDEWVSAPYPVNVANKKTVADGLAWLDGESKKRLGALFADAAQGQRQALCEEIAGAQPAGAPKRPESEFFLLYRNLTAIGFYTSPAGFRDLGYVGNVPLARFDGPPADLVERLGLKDEVTW
jgi:hypothetical protein